MNAHTIGDVLYAGGFRFAPRQPRERRSGNGTPVWRNSYNEGQLEHRIWRPIGGGKVRTAKRILGARLKAARKLEMETRKSRRQIDPGNKNGVLGPVALEVLEYLHSVVDFATGRLDKAIDTIAASIGRSYGATHAALKNLRSHGFLHWIRRCRPTPNKGEAGPQAVQIPNAYVLLCPERLKPLVAHMMSNGPAPTDDSWRREQWKQEREDMLSQLSAAEFLEAEWYGDATAGETFQKLRQIALRLDQERESTKMRDTGGL